MRVWLPFKYADSFATYESGITEFNPSALNPARAVMYALYEVIPRFSAGMSFTGGTRKPK